MSLKVITDNRWHPLKYIWELSKSELDNLFMEQDDIDRANDGGCQFVVYSKSTYELNQFMRVPDVINNSFPGWDGYVPDTYYKGVLIKFSEDLDEVKMGTYLS